MSQRRRVPIGSTQDVEEDEDLVHKQATTTRRKEPCRSKSQEEPGRAMQNQGIVQPSEQSSEQPSEQPGEQPSKQPSEQPRDQVNNEQERA